MKKLILFILILASGVIYSQTFYTHCDFEKGELKLYHWNNITKDVLISETIDSKIQDTPEFKEFFEICQILAKEKVTYLKCQYDGINLKTVTDKLSSFNMVQKANETNFLTKEQKEIYDNFVYAISKMRK